MNIDTRKIEFVQKFLRLRNEKVISLLENILKKEEANLEDISFGPMTEAELNQRIDQSESDFEDDRFKKSAELLAKYE